MHRCKKTIRRFLELVTGELVDRLEVAYTKADPEEKPNVHDQLVEERAKHRVTAALTIVGMAIATLIFEKLLPEA